MRATILRAARAVSKAAGSFGLDDVAELREALFPNVRHLEFVQQVIGLETAGLLIPVRPGALRWTVREGGSQ